jgi:DNA adenine methylase
MRHPIRPNTTTKPRPIVKWAGGKRNLLQNIRQHLLPAFLVGTGTYYEPFAGGAALFFDLLHAPSVLGDANGKLIAMYEAVRDEPESVIEHLKSHPNAKEHYLAVRARNFSAGSAAERAAEFIYANRVGFNGMYRENSSGQFNIPFGRNPNATICDAENLRAVSAALQGVNIVHADFAQTVQAARAGDLVYFDPPYVPTSATSSFTGYVAEGFTARDQVRLRDLALELKQRGVAVVVSNSGAPLVRELYSTGFTIHEVQATRAINSKASGRGRVTELLIT